MIDKSLLINESISCDAAFENFYFEMSQSNIGIFDSINDLVSDTTEIDSAIVINSAIIDTNSIEYYKKTVNDVFLNSLAQDTILSPADTAICDYISSLSYFTAGDAKYLAAALISKEVHPEYVPLRKARPKQNSGNKINQIFGIFPNPTSSGFSISGNTTSLAEILLRSTEGKLLKRFHQTVDKEYSVEEIVSGIYQVKLTEISGNVSFLKLSIIR